MLFCSLCDRKFFDTESVLFRVIGGTHLPYHKSCFGVWLENDKKVGELFGEVFEAPETFERVWRDPSATCPVGP